MDLVSVIIPTYKGSAALKRAIDSVLLQEYDFIEVLVIDDNMPDSHARKDTEGIMVHYTAENKVIYIKHNGNFNGAVARNTGLANARGRYITFLDDDDYYLPNRIEHCVRYLETNKSMIGVYVGVDVMDSNNNITMQVRPSKNLEISDLLLEEMILGTGSNIFIYSEVIKKISGFDTNFVRRQDIEFMIRICRIGTVGYMPDKLIIKSVNGTMNHPQYPKMKETLEQFFCVFSDEIETLGSKKSMFYAKEYRALLDIALYERNRTEINEAKELIEQFDNLTIREQILIFIYSHNMRDKKAICIILEVIKSMQSTFMKAKNKLYK